jgi:hypothetical protein
MNCANHSDREKTAFCQNCGKPLCQECTRKIGDAVFCEPCLAAKLASAAPAAAPFPAPIPAPNLFPQLPHGAPNPLLAGFLGFIPGVGAMYNEQYIKGGVHLIVFVILVSIANTNDVFGIFVAGWEFYMAFEAYQTARARRDGLPLPNPFGLNDLGHKLGIEKSPQPAAPLPPDPYAASYSQPSYGTVPPAGAAPAYPPSYPPSYPQSYPQSYAPPSPAGTPPPSWGVPPTAGWDQYDPQMPPIPPGAVPLDAKVPYPGNRFPAGAIWLIALGALFLLTNGGVLHGFSARLFLPILFFGLAIFIFIRKMTDYGYGFSNDGTPGYGIRVFRALRGSVWLALVGLLFFLDAFTPLHWGHSWPLFIILAGVMTVLQRAVYSGAAAVPPYIPGYGYPPPQPPPAPAAASAAAVPVVPASNHDQEGS